MMIYLKAAALMVLALTAIALVIFGNVYAVVFFNMPSGMFIFLVAIEMVAAGIYMMILEELRKREKKQLREVQR